MALLVREVFCLNTFGAYLLALASKSPRHLSAVFDFARDNDLQEEIGKLVEVHKTGDQPVCNPVDIASDTLPPYTLGRTRFAKTETLWWFQDPERTVFCFPGNIIRPDLILLLQFSDERLIRVLVRFKQTDQSTMGSSETEGVWSAIYPCFYTSNLGLREESQTAVQDLGLGTDKAGDVFSLPILPHLMRKPSLPMLTTATTQLPRWILPR